MRGSAKDMEELLSYLKSHNCYTWLESRVPAEDSRIVSGLHHAVNQLVEVLGELKAEELLCGGSILWASQLWQGYLEYYRSGRSGSWSWLTDWEGDRSNTDLADIYCVMLNYAIQRVGRDQLIERVHS